MNSYPRNISRVPGFMENAHAMMSLNGNIVNFLNDQLYMYTDEYTVITFICSYINTRCENILDIL